jgi:hypothetical protein
MCLYIILGADDDLGDEGGTGISRPDGTTEENSQESEERQPGEVSSFVCTHVKCHRSMCEIDNINYILGW